jgi:hypothetical protein
LFCSSRILQAEILSSRSLIRVLAVSIISTSTIKNEYSVLNITSEWRISIQTQAKYSETNSNNAQFLTAQAHLTPRPTFHHSKPPMPCAIPINGLHFSLAICSTIHRMLCMLSSLATSSINTGKAPSAYMLQYFTIEPLLNHFTQNITITVFQDNRSRSRQL